MKNKKGFVLSTYVYILLVFFLLLLGTMLAVLNNTRLLSVKLKEQVQVSSGLIDKDFSFVLLGDKDFVIEVDEEYIEPGFKIQTSGGTDLTDNVIVDGEVDTSVKGTYTIYYRATYNGVTKELVRNVNVKYPTAVEKISSLVGKGGLQQTNATNDGTTYDAGIRYVGATDVVANKVYFNCEPTDGTNAYGTKNYDYDNSCETWRIIGVFDVEDGSGNTEKRMKIINTESTFEASWDSSASSGANAANSGYGINQWGASTLTDADGNSQPYAGADLMQLLNGYYIGKSGSECKYNNTDGQDGFGQTCTTESLTNAKMKPLTSNALSMIEDAVWYTYAADTSTAATAYLQERGITAQYTGKSECASAGGNYCNDKVNRTTTWTGLVGLMSVSDIGYANGWLYTPGTGVSYAWAISPSRSSGAGIVWRSYSSSATRSFANSSSGVWPAVYLVSNVQIIGGDGLNTPYKLSDEVK